MQSFIIILLTCSVTMSILALFYMVLTPLLAKHYSEKVLYYVWLIIVIGLIIPLRPHFGNALVKIDVSSETVTPIIQMGNGTPVTTPMNNATFSPVLPSISWWQITIIVWLVGVIVFLAYHVIKHFSFVRMVGRWNEKVTDEQTLTLFQCLKKEMELSKKINLYLCSCVGTPMMVGFVNPRILLPKASLAYDEIRFILKHELVHYKRKDLLYKYLVLVATAIHWFNPVAHLMSKAIDVLCEISCDSEVVRSSAMDVRQHYCETIIGVVRFQSKLKTALSTNFYGGKNGMKNRIMSIMDTGKKKAGIIIISVALIATVGTGFVFAANTGINSVAAMHDPKPLLLTEEEKLANEYYNAVNRQKAAESLKEYESFGLTYNADIVDEDGHGQLYFNGEPVCYFADNLATNGKFEGSVYNSGGGTSGVITERNASGELTDLKLLSESELKEYKWYYYK